MGAKSTQNAASRSGARRHSAKVATQSRQVMGGGATTGGFATSPDPSKTTNSAGKFLARGKR